MKNKLLLVSALAACVLAGCHTTSPSQYSSPRLEGRVLDAQTHQPIAGVKVHVVTPREPDVDQAPTGDAALEKTPSVRSGEDGTFVVASERDLELFSRTSWYSITFGFEHAGYSSLMVTYRLNDAVYNTTGEPVVKAGDILLAPLPK